MKHPDITQTALSVPQPVPATRPGEARPTRRAALAALTGGAVLAAGAAVPAAAIAPTAAVALPSGTAIAESPQLLALGSKLDTTLGGYRAAAERLAAARAVAIKLWPEVPPKLVMKTRSERDRFSDCYEREVDFEGKDVWSAKVDGNGKPVPLPPRDILRADFLFELHRHIEDEPDLYDETMWADVAERFAAAERYEEACEHAISSSDIEDAKCKVERLASALHSLLFEVRKYPARSIEGVMILARAVAAYEEAQKDSCCGGERSGGAILGRELAHAVLRIVSVNA